MKNTLKKGKRFFAVTLCIIMILSLCVPMSFAANGGVSINDGMNALRAQYSRGKGPSSGGYAIDYSYFSPVKGSGDNTKYPLVVFLPGGTESTYEGKELTANSFCTWSSREYQARFKDAGGAYIMMARAREDVALSWNSTLLTKGLGAAVRDFIAKNPNVDTDRVYLVGWCYGGTGAINQASAYPELYAAAVIIAPSSGISSSEASKMKNMSVWLDVCKKDSFSLYSTNTSSWNNLKNKAANRSNILLTTYDDAPNAGSLLHHNCWHDACYDMNSGSKDYAGRKTIDGNGNSIDVGEIGMISWLSSQRLYHEQTQPTEPDVPVTPDDSCNCNCHSTTGFTKLFWKIQVFFWKIFGMTSHRQCKCGEVSHW